MEKPIWLEDVRSSPYAEQLSAGFRWLRFAPALEHEFTQFHERESVELKRIALYVGLVVWILFGLSDWWLIQGAEFWLAQLVRVLVLGVLLFSFAMFRRVSSQWVERFSMVSMLAVGLGAAAIVAIAHTVDVNYPYEGLLLVCFAAYFLVGLRLLQALFVSLLVLASYLVMEVLADLPETRLWNNFLFLLVGNFIGAVGCYLLEYKSREHFLMRRLLRLLADHDSLTGLHNRRSFNRQLDQLWRQAQREQESLALLTCDVDHFKAYNDHYGHPAGDQVLQKLGHLLADAARRPLDMAARIGGEEFAVLLYGVDQQQAVAHAESLREALLGLQLAHERSKTLPVVSMSIGVACLRPVEGIALASLLAQADQALYRAKDSGRNQVAH